MVMERTKMSEQDPIQSQYVPSTALFTMLLAFIPLFILMVDGLFNRINLVEVPAHAFHLYGCLVLVFLGGIRWGAAMPENQSGNDRPMLFCLACIARAFVSLLLPTAGGLLLLIVAFSAMGAWDSWSFFRSDELSWYATLRIFSTLLLVAMSVPVWWVAA